MLNNALGAMLTVVNNELEFCLINIHKNSERNPATVIDMVDH